MDILEVQRKGPRPGVQGAGAGCHPLEGGAVRRGAGSLQPGPLGPDPHVPQAEGRPSGLQWGLHPSSGEPQSALGGAVVVSWPEHPGHGLPAPVSSRSPQPLPGLPAILTQVHCPLKLELLAEATVSIRLDTKMSWKRPWQERQAHSSLCGRCWEGFPRRHFCTG